MDGIVGFQVVKKNLVLDKTNWFSERHGNQVVVEYNPTEDKATWRDEGVLTLNLFRKVWTFLGLNKKHTLSLTPKMVEKENHLSHNLCTCMHLT